MQHRIGGVSAEPAKPGQEGTGDTGRHISNGVGPAKVRQVETDDAGWPVRNGVGEEGSRGEGAAGRSRTCSVAPHHLVSRWVWVSSAQGVVLRKANNRLPHSEACAYVRNCPQGNLGPPRSPRWLSYKATTTCVCRKRSEMVGVAAICAGDRRHGGILHGKPHSRLEIGRRIGQRMGSGTTQVDLMALRGLQLAQQFGGHRVPVLKPAPLLR